MLRRLKKNISSMFVMYAEEYYLLIMRFIVDIEALR